MKEKQKLIISEVKLDSVADILDVIQKLTNNSKFEDKITELRCNVEDIKEDIVDHLKESDHELQRQNI